MEADVMLLRVLSAETLDFLEPEEPDAGDLVRIRVRVERGLASRVTLRLSTGAWIPMHPTRETDPFTWYETSLTCPREPLRYRIYVAVGQTVIVCQRFGCVLEENAEDELGRPDFLILPGFHVPAWSKGALQYHIFPDRFRNGDPENDVVEAEYAYDGVRVRGTLAWDAPMQTDDYRSFRGGDLAGILEGLDYIASLGVEALYLNPIFTSPSSHKYDTQDYLSIDPHLGSIVRDGGACLVEGDIDNAHATRYILRTTAPENREASNKVFERLCEELHRRGMRVILDGVFNHSGMASRWMDRSGIYGGPAGDGAYWSRESPYRDFYRFADDGCFAGKSGSYECWLWFSTLPKLNYEGSEELAQAVIGIARHWASPPYSIDGWRLDVASDLGHSREYNHAFWRRFREGVKDVNADVVIVAENYGAAAAWLDGTQWDTTMNFDAFMDPLTFFLTGMERHSEDYRPKLHRDGEAFFESILDAALEYPWPSLLAAMNELSNHDHSRFITRTNGVVGRLHTKGQAAAGDGVDLAVMRQAVAVQMTWPGAPTIYYGDEAGLVGWTDPDNRRPFPWGAEDEELIAYHRAFARVRAAHPCLRHGAIVPLGAGSGWIAFGRLLADDWVAVLVNCSEKPVDVSVRLRMLGAADADELAELVRSDATGYVLGGSMPCPVVGGVAEIALPAKSVHVVGACRNRE